MRSTRYAELGAFLRARRERIRPAEAGLPVGPRRRVAGLRREEVAHLAGASVDYYNELERGAGSQPSEQMLAALARALRLNADEREHLFHLADRPVPRDGGPASHIHPGMLDLLDRLGATPAQIITDLHVTLVQNRLAVALFGDQRRFRGLEASLVYRWFTDPATRAIHPDEDHEAHSRTFAAGLRVAVGRRDARDPEATSLVSALLNRSAEFERLWQEHTIAVRQDERKRIVHPQLGVLDVNCLNLLSENGRQRLLWFTPVPGTDAADLLELLAVIGAHEFSDTPGK
ncbi:helix-turn-helix transcriptional regulator [Actinoallomurus sp. CA-150999]|uniref:helix-turn-helix transcriptional regulator n=1 Tax=Actinoallomurus sp. CA-150999 TaxID=3239887 RepID=UPI003D919D78